MKAISSSGLRQIESNYMNEIKGDMWKIVQDFDAICCPTNMIVNKNGDLIMGAGVAKQFVDRFVDIDKEWGMKTELINAGLLNSNIIVTPRWLTQYENDYNALTKYLYLVSFPTKYHYKDKSSLKLIHTSAIQLYTVAQALWWEKILLPRPGCLNGGLDWETEVKPILNGILDKNFWVITNQEN